MNEKPKIDGSALLAALEAYFSRYLALRPGISLVVSLWTLATYIAGTFDAFGYLAIVSPTKRCGLRKLII